MSQETEISAIVKPPTSVYDVETLIMQGKLFPEEYGLARKLIDDEIALLDDVISDRGLDDWDKSSNRLRKSQLIALKSKIK